MAKQVEIKKSQDKKQALEIVKKKINGLTIPKRSHAHILKLTESLIDAVRKLSNNSAIKLSVTSGLGEKTIKLASPVPLSENLEAYCEDEIVSYSTDFLSVKNKDGQGSISLTIKGSASYALLKTFVTVGIAILASYLINTFATVDIAVFIHTYLTLPIESLFVNALQMIAMPVTFFAIICTTSFFYSDLKDGELGRSLL